MRSTMVDNDVGYYDTPIRLLDGGADAIVLGVDIPSRETLPQMASENSGNRSLVKAANEQMSITLEESLDSGNDLVGHLYIRRIF